MGQHNEKRRAIFAPNPGGGTHDRTGDVEAEAWFPVEERKSMYAGGCESPR